MKKRLRISLVLMLISIGLLAAFQSWWLYKSYKEEQETLNIRTSLLFRETLYGLQAYKLKLDTNLRAKIPSPANAVGVVNSMRAMWRDSLDGRGVKSTMIVSMDHNMVRRRDSGVKTLVRYGPSEIFDVLLASESPKDSLKMEEITASFDKALQQEQLDIPYKVVKGEVRTSLSVGPGPNVQPLRMGQQQDVTLGFVYPITYKLQLGNTFPYLIKQIGSQLLFAVFLLAMTVFSFVVLYRNLLAQKR